MFQTSIRSAVDNTRVHYIVPNMVFRVNGLFLFRDIDLTTMTEFLARQIGRYVGFEFH